MNRLPIPVHEYIIRSTDVSFASSSYHSRALNFPLPVCIILIFCSAMPTITPAILLLIVYLNSIFAAPLASHSKGGSRRIFVLSLTQALIDSGVNGIYHHIARGGCPKSGSVEMSYIDQSNNADTKRTFTVSCHSKKST